MILIQRPEDLVQLNSSIIRTVEMQANPVAVKLAIDGPDEMRYTLLITPNYSIQSTPVAATISLGIGLTITKEKTNA